jgi:acyl carrier protein
MTKRVQLESMITPTYNEPFGRRPAMLQPGSQRVIEQPQLDKLLDLIAKEGMIDRSRLSMDATIESLGLKSPDLLIVLMAIEEQFGVYIPVDDSLSDARTLGDLVNALAGHLPHG